MSEEQKPLDLDEIREAHHRFTTPDGVSPEAVMALLDSIPRLAELKRERDEARTKLAVIRTELDEADEYSDLLESRITVSEILLTQANSSLCQTQLERDNYASQLIVKLAAAELLLTQVREMVEKERSETSTCYDRLSRILALMDGRMRSQDNESRPAQAKRETVIAQTGGLKDPCCGECAEKVEFEQKFCHECGGRLEWA